MDLLWNPADPTHHVQTRLSYVSDGTIKSDCAEFDRQLNKVLNLNLPRLKNSRKGIVDAILEWLQREGKLVTRQRLEQAIGVRSAPNGELAPYVQVAIWWLEKTLMGMP